MKLDEVNIGEKIQIIDMSALDKATIKRLMDLGIYEGVEVEIKNKMMFGGPLIIESNGQSIGIRCKCSKQIVVKLKE